MRRLQYIVQSKWLLYNWAVFYHHPSSLIHMKKGIQTKRFNPLRTVYSLTCLKRFINSALTSSGVHSISANKTRR